MRTAEEIRAEIQNRLSEIIDPETGLDLVRMRMIPELAVDENGFVSVTFRPSSPFCPVALPLSLNILGAVRSVDGVSGQKLEIIDYIQADKLNELLQDLITEFSRERRCV